ncbi:MAG TPA: DUF4336 domain-containing protein, partial [Kofleriaceae bacterium]|nr:DUF4336 domain-containing protein [Kofleriaceae bacterium]
RPTTPPTKRPDPAPARPPPTSMASFPPHWTIARHGALTALADGLWTVDAELSSLPIGRRMTLVRLPDGGLAVHSAVACDDATMAAIDRLGPVRFVIVPSGFHRLDAPAFAARYPDARIVTTAASRARVGRRVDVHGDYGLVPGGDLLSFEPLDGLPAEAVFVHRAPDGSETLVFNDGFMNLPASLPGFKGWLVKLMGSTGGPKVTRTARLALVKDRRAYADHLRRLAARPRLARVVPGHGAVIVDGAAAALVRAADGLHRGG